MMNTVISDEAFLDAIAPKEMGGNGTETARELIFRVMLQRMKIVSPPGASGYIGQILACLTHNCSHENLSKIAKYVPDVLIITGGKDKMIDPACTEIIYREMSGAGFSEPTKSSVKCVRYPSKGHGLMMEAYFEYHKEFEANIAAGNKRWQ